MVCGSECNDKHGDLFHGGNLSSTWLLNIKASHELLGGTQNMTALLGRHLFYLSSIIFIHIFRPCLFVTWIPGYTWMDLYFEFYGVGNILINMNTAELELHKKTLWWSASASWSWITHWASVSGLYTSSKNQWHGALYSNLQELPLVIKWNGLGNTMHKVHQLLQHMALETSNKNGKYCSLSLYTYYGKGFMTSINHQI